MPNTIVDCVYVSDKGAEFRYRVNSEILAQVDSEDPANVKIGNGSVADPVNVPGDLLRLPSSVKPRRALLQSTTTKKQRTVVLLNPDAVLLTVPGTTLSIEDSDGAAQTYKLKKFHAEDFGRG